MKRLPLVLLAVLTIGTAMALAEAEEPKVDIDFSCVGVGAGKPMLIVGPLVWRVRPSGGDDTALIQAALDDVASRLMGADGLRGTVVLEEGTFRVEGQLRVKADGVALIGCNDRTIVLATGLDRRALIWLGGDEAPKVSTEIAVTDETVRAGSTVLTIADVGGFTVGDRVVVRRPSTAEWIADLGMDKWPGSFASIRLNWLPGSMDLRWDRSITAIDSTTNSLMLDAPITTALDARYGGGFVAKVIGGEPVTGVALGNLVLDSEYDTANPKDEEHAWIAVQVDNAEDVEVSAITVRHFVSSAVRVGPRARRVSVGACASEMPVAEVGGYRRQSFVVEGQQVYVWACRADLPWNAFSVGQRAAGPNLISNGLVTNALGSSGVFESWASGVVFKRIKGTALDLSRNDRGAQGGGWTAANAVALCWEDPAKLEGPAMAPVIRESRDQGRERAPEHVLRGLPNRFFTKEGIVLGVSDVPEFRFSETHPVPAALPNAPELEIVNGRFVVDGRVLWGGAVNTAWWKGRINPEIAANYGRSPTRFVPGRTGPGLTEDLEEFANWMQANGTPFFRHWPGLWYDRRRDDHLRVDRTDANCWAPFYEMPWARSGQGTAADGLSKYDLTKFNPWYFSRLRELARLCGERGIVFFNDLYNTHNVLETGAHWMDFPWRPANNINGTPLPEPPPLDAKGGIHVANEFYNEGDRVLRALHRAFILHSLDQLGEQSNVIHGLAFQYAGPLAFQQFFQDTVAEWEQAHGRRLRLALTTGKNVTDAILADPVRAAQIAVIDQRYWQYRPNGSLWAPEAGRNLAFREMNAAQFGKAGGDSPPPTTPAMVYRQVREYRDRFPDKAIIAPDGGNGPVPVLMAGGAVAITSNPAAGGTQGRSGFDAFVTRELGAALQQMTPRDGWLVAPANNWCLADEAGETVLFCSVEGEGIQLASDLPQASYAAEWVDPRTGSTQMADVSKKWTRGAVFRKPSVDCWLLLLRAEQR